MLIKVIKWIRLTSGMASIQEVCEASRDGNYDYHDYFKHTGGDGTPSHFHEYACWNCKKKFSI